VANQAQQEILQEKEEIIHLLKNEVQNLKEEAKILASSLLLSKRGIYNEHSYSLKYGLFERIITSFKIN
jgi:hypothetical protein